MSESKVKAKLAIVNGSGSNVAALMTGLRGEKLLESASHDAGASLTEEQYIIVIEQLKRNTRKANPSGNTFENKYNMYVCENCKGHILTQDVDAGVTPFMIKCKAVVEDGCTGIMRSMMYQLPQRILAEAQPRVEMRWRYPRYEEFVNLDAEYRAHILRGGLVPVTGE